jgi:lipoprotein-anchoring transpeptidase ErfK/SrfK
MTSRRYRLTRKGARAATLVAVVSMALVAIEAAARAQQAESAGGRPDPDATIAEGVTIAGVGVGGLTVREAERAVSRYASRPVTVTFRKESWRFAPQTLGAKPQLDTAVQAALGAPIGASLPLRVEVDQAKLRRWKRQFAARFDQKRRNAVLVLRKQRPVLKESRTGRELSRWTAGVVLTKALEAHERDPVELPARIVKPTVTAADIGPAIVIKRSSNRLIFYRPGGAKGMRMVRKFGVATGQASFPTPLGSFEIVRMQRNPWWLPPDSDWAEGAEPIPPGPGNPLGTRWMGLSTPAVGIHGTPDAASIGYSASHGCIRMLVPEAEWLFERVEEGTPVYILDA